MTKLAVFLTDRFADWECALCMATARTYYGMEVQTVTFDGKPVTSSGGLVVTPDIALSALDNENLDAFLIAGGAVWSTDDAPNLTSALKQLHEKGTTIAAICDAVNALARAGLLNQTKHTGNALEPLQALSGYAGSDHYQDTPLAVQDNQIITAAGTSPISFMRQIMTELGKAGPELDFYTGLFAAEHQQQPHP